MSTGRRRKGGGARWTIHCRWQVRLLDADGDPVSTWRWCDTLRDCRQELTNSIDERAIGAEIKHDGDQYGHLVRVGAVSRLIRHIKAR